MKQIKEIYDKYSFRGIDKSLKPTAMAYEIQDALWDMLEPPSKLLVKILEMRIDISLFPDFLTDTVKEISSVLEPSVYLSLKKCEESWNGDASIYDSIVEYLYKEISQKQKDTIDDILIVYRFLM